MVDNIKKKRSYGIDNPLQKLSPLPIVGQCAPTGNDKNFPIGQPWIDQSSNKSYVLIKISNNQAVWKETSVQPSIEYPITKYVVAKDGSTPYTTIQSAIDAISAALDTPALIHVRPGIYNENLTLIKDIVIEGIEGSPSQDGASTTIIGTHLPPVFFGWITFKNLILERNVSGSIIETNIAGGLCNIGIKECVIKLLSGFVFNFPSSWNGNLYYENSISKSTNDGFINNGGSGTTFINDAEIGAGTALSGVLSQSLIANNSTIRNSLIFGGGIPATPIIINNCYVTNNLNFSSPAAGLIVNSHFETGSIIPITQNSSSQLKIIKTAINSTASPNVITGSGTVQISDVTFPTNSGISGSLTIDNTSSTVLGGLKLIEGTNATMGIVTLTAGTATINTTRVTANSRIYLTHQNNAGTPGFISVTARIVGTSFTITSSNAGDTSDIAWMIVEPQ